MKTEFRNILKENGLKATKQRLLILEILHENRQHPSSEIIFKELEKRGEHIALSSVYNILDAFCERNIINKFYSSDEIMRFDVNTNFHVHLCSGGSSDIEDFCDEEICGHLQQYLTEHFSRYGEIKDIELKIHINKE